VIKWERVRFVGHVARLGDNKSIYWVWGVEMGDLKKRSHFENIGIDGMIILKRILRN
jgi:hypothetical protein